MKVINGRNIGNEFSKFETLQRSVNQWIAIGSIIEKLENRIIFDRINNIVTKLCNNKIYCHFNIPLHCVISTLKHSKHSRQSLSTETSMKTLINFLENKASHKSYSRFPTDLSTQHQLPSSGAASHNTLYIRNGRINKRAGFSSRKTRVRGRLPRGRKSFEAEREVFEAASRAL